MKKAKTFAGLGNDYDGQLFVSARGTVIESCDCRIAVIIPEIAFLKTDVPMVIRPGEKVDFSQVAIKEAGWLLQRVANLRGMGILTVSQDADKTELRIAEWTRQFSGLGSGTKSRSRVPKVEGLAFFLGCGI